MASVSNITNKVINKLGKDELTLVSTGANQKGACVGLSLANLTKQTVNYSIMVEDEDGVKGYYAYDIELAPKASARVINGGEKLLLAPNNTVSLVCDTKDAIDVIFSLVVITYS
jgi:hypothetical protein